MKYKISDMLDSYSENTVDIKSKDVASRDRIKELTMNKINAKTEDMTERIKGEISNRILPEKRNRLTKRGFALLTAAALMLSLAVTAMATYELWQPVWAEYFGVNEKQQTAMMEEGTTELVDGASVTVKSINTEANFTITAEQVIGDKHTLQVLLKFTSDTPGAFTKEFMRNATILSPIRITINGKDPDLTGGGGFLRDTADDYSCYYQFQTECLVDDWKDSTIVITGVFSKNTQELLDDPTISEEDKKTTRELWEIEQINPLRLEDWNLSFSLQDLADTTKTIELNKSVDIAGEAVTVDYIDISPISLYIKYNSALDESLEPYSGELTLSDGNTISFELDSCNEYNDWLYFLDYKTYEGVLDVSKVVSITLRDRESQEIIAQINLQ